MTGWSSLAKPAARIRTGQTRKNPLYGCCIHTTGSGPLAQAKAAWRGMKTPIDVVLSLYGDKNANFSQYAIAENGNIWQIASENTRAWHAGIDVAEKNMYLNGSWRRKVSQEALSFWEKAWPSHQNPMTIFPQGDPNEVYIGIELIPQANSTFTYEQYLSLSNLMKDIWTRNGLFDPQADPTVFWNLMRASGRMVFHEDLEPLTRWDSHGGWDIGNLRANPRFAMDTLLALLVA